MKCHPTKLTNMSSRTRNKDPYKQHETHHGHDSTAYISVLPRFFYRYKDLQRLQGPYSCFGGNCASQEWEKSGARLTKTADPTNTACEKPVG